MKLFLIILPIVLMAHLQVAVAKSNKEFEEFQKGVEGLYDVLKSSIPLMENVVQETLKTLPETEEYAKYREDLEEYLQDVVEYKSKSGLCMEKTLRIVNHFDKFEDQYNEEDAPAEAKEVINQFNKNGYGDILHLLAEWAKTYGKIEIIRHLHDPDTTDAIRMLPMALKVC